MTTINTCKVCTHMWEQRNPDEKSKSCPRCKRYDWENPIAIKPIAKKEQNETRKI